MARLKLCIFDMVASVRIATPRRRLEFAWMVLIGLAGDVWCGWTHICRSGHLEHMSFRAAIWNFASDFIWLAFLMLGGVAAWRSNLRLRKPAVGLLALLFYSRFLFQSGGGMLFLFIELPVVLCLGIYATCILAGERSRSNSSAIRTQVP